MSNTLIHPYPEVGNVTSKRNGVPRYHDCFLLKAKTDYSNTDANVFRAIIIISDNDPHMGNPITNRSKNISDVLRAITIRSDKIS
jgi:hypothetical protein